MAATNIKPLGDQVLVKRAEASEETDGGIFLPESAKDKPQEGMVLAVGNGRVLDDGSRSTFTVKQGDRIVFTSYAGTEVTYTDEDYLLMRESDILGILG
ncbi:MAG: co-chaperone GroES [Planctomycetota bacterium]